MTERGTVPGSLRTWSERRPGPRPLSGTVSSRPFDTSFLTSGYVTSPAHPTSSGPRDLTIPTTSVPRTLDTNPTPTPSDPRDLST